MRRNQNRTRLRVEELGDRAVPAMLAGLADGEPIATEQPVGDELLYTCGLADEAAPTDESVAVVDPIPEEWAELTPIRTFDFAEPTDETSELVDPLPDDLEPNVFFTLRGDESVTDTALEEAVDLGELNPDSYSTMPVDFDPGEVPSDEVNPDLFTMYPTDLVDPVGTTGDELNTDAFTSGLTELDGEVLDDNVDLGELPTEPDDALNPEIYYSMGGPAEAETPAPTGSTIDPIGLDLFAEPTNELAESLDAELPEVSTTSVPVASKPTLIEAATPSTTKVDSTSGSISFDAATFDEWFGVGGQRDRR